MKVVYITGHVGRNMDAEMFALKAIEADCGQVDAYVVADDNGRRRVVRSPGRTWSPGDQVDVVGGRLVARTVAESAAD